MKYMKRANIYQASNYNVTFEPTKCEAHSYRWWRFVAVVEGKVVFNNYFYSPSTAKHQSKVRSLLRALNIKIDIEMPLAMGIIKAGETLYRGGQSYDGQTLEQMIVESEELLCDKFFADILKKQDRYHRNKERKNIEKIERAKSDSALDCKTKLSLVGA